MTSEQAILSARKVALDKKNQDTEPYKCIDAYTRVMPDWDKVAHVINDLAHGMSHLTKNILMLSANSGQMSFTTTRRSFEHKIGRFLPYNGTNAPWRTSTRKGLSMEEVWMNLKVYTHSFSPSPGDVTFCHLA